MLSKPKDFARIDKMSDRTELPLPDLMKRLLSENPSKINILYFKLIFGRLFITFGMETKSS